MLDQTLTFVVFSFAVLPMLDEKVFQDLFGA